MPEAMYYTLSLPVSTVIIGCDSIAQLEENVELARDFTPLNGSQMPAIAQKPNRFPNKRSSSAFLKGRKAAPFCPRPHQRNAIARV